MESFYEAINTESRLQKINLSNGICKICTKYTENIKHVLYSCEYLETFWNRVTQLIQNINEHFVLNYQTIILGDKCIVTNLIVHTAKFCAWKWRNLVIF